MRVNVEGSVYTDPRFKRLAHHLGGVKLREAIGGMVGVWFVCYERRTPFLTEEDIDIAGEQAGFTVAMVRSDLAQLAPEGYHVAGVDDRIGFLLEQEERSSAGGKEKARRDREARAIAAAVASATAKQGALPKGAERYSEGHGIAMPAHASPDLAPDLDLALTPDLAPEESGPAAAPPPVRPPGRPVALRALPLDPSPPEPATGKPGRSDAKRKPRAVPDTEWHQAIHAFDQLFRAYCGEGARWKDKERGQMKQLLEAGATVEQIGERASVMFDLAPKYPAEHPDMGTLLANWDKFVKPERITQRVVGQGKVATSEEHGPSREEPWR